MKTTLRLLLAAALPFSPLAVRAATPTFSSFYTNHFTTNTLTTNNLTIIKVNTNWFPSIYQFNTNNFSTNGSVINIVNQGSNAVVFAYPVGIPPFLSYWLDTNHLSESSLYVIDPTTVGFISMIGQTLDVTGAGTNEFNNLQATNFIGNFGPYYGGQSVGPWWSPDGRDGMVLLHDASVGESNTIYFVVGAIDSATATVTNTFLRFRSDSSTGTLNILFHADDGVSVNESELAFDPVTGAAYTLTSLGSTSFSIAPVTGWAGGGTLAFMDDGTFKDISTFVTNALTPANPSASIGLSAVNGSSTNYMRADAAPALGAVGTAGTYGTATTYPIIGTDSAGRVTNVTTAALPLVTNYFVGNGGSLTITTNVSGTNVSWTFTGTAQTNVAGANPTASVGLSAVNGSALTFLRSDGAPALSQSITPTWTGNHTYSGANVLALLSVGATNYFDLNFPTQTNQVTAALAFAFATNGVDGSAGTVLREFYNSSGSDQTVTWPSLWRTNLAAPLPAAFTNTTITKVLLEIVGPTGTAAQQTNAHVIGVTYNK